MKQLVWTSAARADLDSIAEYHAATDHRVGDMLVGRIEEAAAKLVRYDTPTGPCRRYAREKRSEHEPHYRL